MFLKTSKKQASLIHLRIIIALIFLQLFNPFLIRAQCISNNSIQLVASCTVNGLAMLKGSTPTGGNGNYTYAWEKNKDKNCDKGKFTRIAGATGADYLIPKGRDAEACYRRIVSSGNCTVESNKIKVKPKDVPAPSLIPVPQVSLQLPQSCSQATGSITVTTVQGAQYSINGSTYQESNVFSNLAPGTYSVTIKSSAGCVSLPTIAIIVAAPAAPAAPQASAQSPASCSQATGTITVTQVQGAQYSINGTTYQQSNVFSNLAPGSYRVTLKNPAGCVSPVTQVTIAASPSAPSGSIIPASANICEGRNQLLAANGGTAYQWKLNGIDIPGATSSSYLATRPGTYTVIIKNGNCSAPARNNAVLQVQACIIIGQSKAFVPEAFTPNQDNTNDQLRPYFKNVTELKYFKVFNRWGQMVFQTNKIDEGWTGDLKGQPQPSETYSWMLEYINHEGKTVRESGTTILVR
jgi:gliding motility-associated-like protein